MLLNMFHSCLATVGGSSERHSTGQFDFLQLLHSPVHQALLLYQPLCLLSGDTTMEPRLGPVDGCKHTQRPKCELVMRRDEVQDQDRVDLQEGLLPELTLGRLHLRASLLWTQKRKTDAVKSG